MCVDYIYKILAARFQRQVILACPICSCEHVQVFQVLYENLQRLHVHVLEEVLASQQLAPKSPPPTYY